MYVRYVQYITRAYLFSNFGRCNAVMHEKFAQGSQKNSDNDATKETKLLPRLLDRQVQYFDDPDYKTPSFVSTYCGLLPDSQYAMITRLREAEPSCQLFP